MKKQRRCSKGHLIDKTKKDYCTTCYHLTAPARPAQLRARARIYWHMTARGLSVLQRMYVVVPGNEVETQKRLERYRQLHRRTNRNYRQRWGCPERNFKHRFRQEMIKAGEWKEEEHPL